MENTLPQNAGTIDPAKAIESMIEQYGDGLLRLCCLYMGDNTSAEDAWQETCLQAFRHYGTFRHECSEKTWLTGIAVNVCRSALRREKLRRLHFIPLPDGLDEEKIPEGDAPDTLFDDTVMQAIRQLAPKYREVILMFYYQEMKGKEIAEVLGISESAVTVRLTRARAQLKESLSDWYYDL